MMGRFLNKINSLFCRYIRKINRILFNRTHVYDVRELFFQQNLSSGFNRYDMIVRLLAVENYYGKNDYGFSLYKKMQAARISPEWVEPAVERFKILIESYEKKGYDESSCIIIDKNLNLIDGSHRMAMAMFYKKYKISCKVIPQIENIQYGLEEFIEYDFTEKEIEIIHNKYLQIKEEINVPFVCTLWAPVQDFYDEIIRKLSKVGKVVGYKDFIFDEYNYASIVRKIYAVDDIAKWKIEMKIDKMKTYESKRIRVVLLTLESPEFRYKATNKNTLSVTCERIKKMIRNNYKQKIPNYFHDIIMHIGDNFYQNEFIANLFEYSSVSVKDVMESLESFPYALSKMQVPYMPKQFPELYPIGKDVDILCLPGDLDSIAQIIQNRLEKCDFPYTIRFVEKTNMHKQIRIELDGVLIFLFDVIADEIHPDFVTEAIKNRVKESSCYVLDSAYEIIIRINEIYKYPKKSHHRQYVKDNKSNINYMLCDKFFNYNWKKIVEEL